MTTVQDVPPEDGGEGGYGKWPKLLLCHILDKHFGTDSAKGGRKETKRK